MRHLRLGERVTFSVPVNINEETTITFSEPPEPLLISHWNEQDAPGLVDTLRRWWRGLQRS